MEKYNRKELLSILDSNGIFVDEAFDINEELVIDSITFVTLIVDIEQSFQIVFEDSDFEIMVGENLITIAILEKIIMEKVIGS